MSAPDEFRLRAAPDGEEIAHCGDAGAGEHDRHADRAGADECLDHAAFECEQGDGGDGEERELPSVQHEREQDCGAEDRADRCWAGTVQERSWAVWLRRRSSNRGPPSRYERERRRECDDGGQQGAG